MVNDKSMNDNSAGNTSLNADESVKVKPDESHFKSEHNVLTDNYAGAQVNENESPNVRPNLRYHSRFLCQLLVSLIMQQLMLMKVVIMLLQV